MMLNKCPNCKLKCSGDHCVVCEYPFPKQGGQWVGYNGARYALWRMKDV